MDKNVEPVKPFAKIKHIRVSGQETYYIIELVCPQCNFFKDQEVSVNKNVAAPFNKDSVTFLPAHICDVKVKQLDRSAIAAKSTEHLTNKARGIKK